MKSRFQGMLVLLISPLLFLSCGQADTVLVEIQEQRTEKYVVALLGEAAELQQSSNHLLLEFRDVLTNELSEVENVQIQAMMSMPGMAPMFGNVHPPEAVDPGRYSFDTDFTMVGRWSLIVTFDPDGRVQFNVNAY